MLAGNEQATGYTFGERGTTIAGTVWKDEDRDGVRDANELTVLPNVVIVLMDSTGTPVLTTTTDANGNYTFTAVLPGNYDD